MTNPTNPPGSLADLADDLASLQALAERLDARETALQAKLDRISERADRVSDRVAQARLRLIEAVLERSPRDSVGRQEWHHGTGPIVQVRDDGQSYILTRSVCDEDSTDVPETRAQLARRSTLLILPDPTLAG